MDFFGVGMGEVLLVLVVALVIWGPTRIVEISSKLGRITRNLKRATTDLTSQLTKEIEVGDENPSAASGEKLPPASEDRAKSEK